jgi:hypothetical protein
MPTPRRNREVDRFNPRTLAVSYTDGTICTYSVEQLRSLEPIRVVNDERDAGLKH